MAAHFRFVRDHHKRIKKVAVVTDAALGNLAEKLASHFVAATVRRFPAGELKAAEQWIMNRPPLSACASAHAISRYFGFWPVEASVKG